VESNAGPVEIAAIGNIGTEYGANATICGCNRDESELLLYLRDVT
jgi:hypothetical protein